VAGRGFRRSCFGRAGYTCHGHKLRFFQATKERVRNRRK
jgi:hypothetical protein